MSNSEKINQYKNLLYNMNTVRDQLGNALYYVNEASSSMPNAYSVDDVSGDNGYLKNQSQQLSSLYTSLRYTIIPRIEAEIRALEAEGEDV